MEKVAIIKKTRGGFALYSHHGKVLGHHGSRESAIKQEQAIAINKHAELAFILELQKLAGFSEAFEKAMPAIDDVVAAQMNGRKNKNNPAQQPMQKLSYNRDPRPFPIPAARHIDSDPDLGPTPGNAGTTSMATEGQQQSTGAAF